MELSQEEQELVKNYRKSDSFGKHMLQQSAEVFADIAEQSNDLGRGKCTETA